MSNPTCGRRPSPAMGQADAIGQVVGGPAIGAIDGGVAASRTADRCRVASASGRPRRRCWPGRTQPPSRSSDAGPNSSRSSAPCAGLGTSTSGRARVARSRRWRRLSLPIASRDSPSRRRSSPARSPRPASRCRRSPGPTHLAPSSPTGRGRGCTSAIDAFRPSARRERIGLGHAASGEARGAVGGRRRELPVEERLALTRRLPDLGEVVPLEVDVGRRPRRR